MKKLLRPLRKWFWEYEHNCWELRLTRWGRSHATVFHNGVWHTWDKTGCGGENSKEQTIQEAKSEAYESAIRQGFI